MPFCRELPAMCSVANRARLVPNFFRELFPIPRSQNRWSSFANEQCVRYLRQPPSLCQIVASYASGVRCAVRDCSGGESIYCNALRQYLFGWPSMLCCARYPSLDDLRLSFPQLRLWLDQAAYTGLDVYARWLFIYLFITRVCSCTDENNCRRTA